MAAPTLVSYTETASWVTIGSPKTTAAVTWQAGDVIAVISGDEGNGTLGTPTATGLTFAVQKSRIGGGTTCSSLLAAVVAAAPGSQAVSMTNSAGTDEWGFGVWVWRGAAGIGVSVESHTASQTAALTPNAADSGIIWGCFDFTAGAVATIVPTPSDTRQRVQSSPHITTYVADLLDQPSTGATSYGISGGGAGPFSIVALEIQALPSGGTIFMLGHT